MNALRLLFLLILSTTVYTNPAGFTDIDSKNYEEGKQHYNELHELTIKTKMPEYGQCWKDAILKLQKGCKEITDQMQSRLALAYLNCFNRLQGQRVYACEWEQPIETCLAGLTDADRTSLATFFTYTQNICYFLESQVWHENTEKTIDRLATSSEDVASQMEDLLHQADNLSHIISTSSNNIRVIFEELKNSTREQRMLINDVIDTVARLQSVVYGEFSGFYFKVFYYILSVLICYLLTSVNRTASSRFYLFGIQTLFMIAEWKILSWIPDFESRDGSSAAKADYDETVYIVQWWYRRVSEVLCLAVLIVSAYRYKDHNVVNNQLLMEIHKQNSELKPLIQGMHSELKNLILATRYESDTALSDVIDSNSRIRAHVQSTSTAFIPSRKFQRQVSVGI